MRVAADRWISLLTMARLLGAAVAIVLLLAHRVTDDDSLLALLTGLWTAATLWVVTRMPRVRRSPAAWGVDAAVALTAIVVSGDWRSPFYLYALTTLVLPATHLPWRRAFAWGWLFTLGYAIAALLTDQVPADTIENTIRLETLATHLLMPVVITGALAYAVRVLDRVAEERLRAEGLLIAAERQRIAWELHDSAKQRVHAAHLMLSALDGRLASEDEALVDAVLSELRGATADMETSIDELREPVVGRPVGALLRERAAALRRIGSASIDVDGELPALAPATAAHVFRIGSEAMVNAIRHSGCSRVGVVLRFEGGDAVLEVADDGVGLPGDPSEGQGLRAMRGRAERIGATLDFHARTGGGTRVELRLPLHRPAHQEVLA